MGKGVLLSGDLAVADVSAIEQVAFRSWPGLDVRRVDGWHLRFAHGITQRANSVWPGESCVDVEQNLAAVEAYYHAHGLPARFQICPASQPFALDEMLDGRGYQSIGRTAVQHVDLGTLLLHRQGRTEFAVDLSSQPSAAWWDCYATADQVAAGSVAVRQRICGQIGIDACYASVLFGGRVIAVGSATVDAGWIGFFNIATLPEYRRRGAATLLMARLSRWGQQLGAIRAYLQVTAGNHAALRVYERLGFTTGYFYHYREEVWQV